MYLKKKTLLIITLFFIINITLPAINADEIIKADIRTTETNSSKYPDYAKMYVGEDKYEKFNRKMFTLNSKLNKFAARPVHIIWSSIMPKYGMDRIKNAYNNIEYPKRLASCIIQKDGEGIKKETVRFLTNTTIGIGGLFDPADKLFNIKPTNETMEQALCKCKMPSGSYLVAPVLNSCTPRTLCGRALEAALDPSVYLATPLTGLIKFGLMLNRTSYMQPLAKMIESTYADPYDIQKKLFGLENYIRNSNLDRQNLLSTEAKIADEIELENNENVNQITGAASNIDNIEASNKNEILAPDIILKNFNPQSPVVDSMRTALFEDEKINKSIWNDLSIWNRSFAKKIKTGTIVVTPGRDNYKYRYILQKDKNAPMIIFYPSIGEGSDAHHAVVMAKLFYDEGYSVIMQGSHFHWEFAKSMPEGYCPGLPSRDVDYIKLITYKILNELNQKYGYECKEKYVIGTSFGAMATLFLAEKESKNNTLNINKFIAISPPIELTYALEQLDKNADDYEKNLPEVKHKTAVTAAKILQIFQVKDNNELKTDEQFSLPFSEEEGKLITTFILRQKLSDLIFAIENIARGNYKDKTEFYEMVNNMSYRDYANKYILKNSEITIDDLNYQASLFSLSDYLANNDNYSIYHSMDDYFINQEQINRLKSISGKHLICLSNGSHLGFMYRKEFTDLLKSDIKNKS